MSSEMRKELEEAIAAAYRAIGEEPHREEGLDPNDIWKMKVKAGMPVYDKMDLTEIKKALKDYEWGKPAQREVKIYTGKAGMEMFQEAMVKQSQSLADKMTKIQVAYNLAMATK